LTPETAILLAYAIHGAYRVWREPWTDNEQAYLPVSKADLAARYQAEFGGALPARYPWRLPLEYALYAWVPTRWPILGRVAAWLASLGVVALAMALGGPTAGLVILTCPHLVGSLVTASYVTPVAGLWLLGLYGALQGTIWLQVIPGWLLLLLRASAWPLGAFLASWMALPVVAWLAWRHQPVIRHWGWTRLLLREPCPVKGIPQDGWGYAAKIAIVRYYPIAIWGLFTLIWGRGSAEGYWILGLTLGGFVVSHFPRMRIRPKWAVGYLPEHLPAVAAGLGMLLEHA
jgi:hypothetical protein